MKIVDRGSGLRLPPRVLPLPAQQQLYFHNALFTNDPGLLYDLTRNLLAGWGNCES